MVNRMKLIGIGALAGLAALAAAQGFRLVSKPTIGEEAKYSVKANIDLGGMSATMSGTQSEKTTDVDKDGNYTVESKLIDGNVEFGGQQMALPAGNATVTVFRKDGTVKEIRGDSVEGGSYRFANLASVYLPDQDLKVGDEWTKEAKADSTTQAVAYKATFKIAGEEKVGTVDTVKIAFSVKETEGETPAASEGTTWIEKANGKMVKTEQKWTNAPFPGAPGPVSGTVTVTRVSP